MFEGFETRRITVRGAELNLRVGGDGPPVLLLHGFPQTHLAWHRVAPVLAERFTLVVPDLPGYGASRGLAPTPEAYSKRNLAAVMVELMDGLGHRQFALAGHDRGGRIGYRLALDHPGVLTRFAPVDILPTLEVWEAMDWQAALGGYHWLLLAQPAPLPETLVGADGPGYVRHLVDRWAGHRDRLDPAAVDAYAAAYADPEVVAAACADYRAGATLDADFDRADRTAGRRIDCPVLLVWARRYLKERGRRHLDVWRRWAEDVREVSLDCGHFVAEEAAEDCAAALLGFFSGDQ
ncbi:haloacetate dehalogenase [Thalassobaculum fulvum]|uniref:Haloacetate dehalogenase n=1 Tax=Thalassobaculum fulvum TaxID=1633335 RepID=A0A918XUX1_9PROT|nr:alpha/beta hydrolase [Thalassobaculum fulvum]GHD56484.1 haloacetate dehalogenase [Thalassobaculum fulvum]